MTIDTDELSASLGRIAGREPVPDAPVGLVLRQAHREHRTRRTQAVAAALVVVVAAGGIAWTARPAATSPDLSLAAAVDATASTSYTFTLTVTVEGDESTSEGAFDPAGPTGYLRGAIGTLSMDERVVDGVWYVGTKPEGQDMFWVKEKPGFAGFALQQGTELTSDPGALLKAFTSLGTVTDTGRRGSGDNAVDTHAFTFQRAGDLEPTTGTVEVGVGPGKVRKISWRARGNDSPNYKPWYTVTIAFSNYGTEVKVDRPM